MGHKRLNTIRELARRMRSLEKSPAGLVERNSFRSFAAERGSRADLMEDAESERMEIRSTLAIPAESGVVEWMADGPGCGAAAIALALTERIASRPGAIVVVDPQREFYPPGATAIGVDLAQIVVVRPADQAAALWAFEQALRCRGVRTALLRRGPLDDRASRRLQLATEQGGGVGLLIRPACFRRQTSWADVRLLVRPVADAGISGQSAEKSSPSPPPSALFSEWAPCGGEGRGEGAESKREPAPSPPAPLPHMTSNLVAYRTGGGEGRRRRRFNFATEVSGPTRMLHIEVLFRRGAVAGGAAIVEFCHETGDVRVVPQLAGATRVVRGAVGA